jgi:hypothetical protein
LGGRVTRLCTFRQATDVGTACFAGVSLIHGKSDARDQSGQ